MEPNLTRRNDWGHYGDDNPMTRGEFYARLDIINARFEEYDERLRSLETTVYAPRNFLISLITSTSGRFMLILIAFLVAWVFGALGLNPIKDLFGF